MSAETSPQTVADGPAPLYPAAVPFDSGILRVGGGHRLAYSQRGAVDGIPALLLHGGPGSGSSPAQARFFDPGRYRVIQFDQRGCGLSQPAGETHHNRTALLLADIETLRRRLGVARWLVVGGSWGATLGAAYAAAQRPAATGVLLRGVFLSGGDDVAWFLRGAAAFHPAAWADLLHAVPQWGHGDPLPWLGRVFAGDDAPLQEAVAAAWFAWERVLGGLPPAPAPQGEALEALCRRYRVHCHYLARRCWLGRERVLKACAGLQGVPVAILHGRADMVCRPIGAWLAHRACPGSRLQWVDGAGHDPFHPAMAAAMVAALDRFAAGGEFA